MRKQAAAIATLAIMFGNVEAKDLPVKTLLGSMELKEGSIVSETIDNVKDRINVEIDALRPFETEKKCSLNINLDKWGKVTGVKPLEKNDFCLSLVGRIWKIESFDIPLNTEVYNALKSFNIHLSG